MNGWRRWRYGHRAALTPLAAMYRQPAVRACARFIDTELLALDIETTGLDEKKDRILSIGWVLLQNGRICLRESGQVLISGGQVGHSATIHGLVDSDVADGLSQREALLALLPHLLGRVLLAHCADIERQFISRACVSEFGLPPLLQTLDTMAIEAKLRHNERLADDGLRLHACRQRYHLPNYRAHNAAVDALACGELLLAQVEHLGSRERLSLGQLGLG